MHYYSAKFKDAIRLKLWNYWFESLFCDKGLSLFIYKFWKYVSNLIFKTCHHRKVALHWKEKCLHTYHYPTECINIAILGKNLRIYRFSHHNCIFWTIFVQIRFLNLYEKFCIVYSVFCYIFLNINSYLRVLLTKWKISEIKLNILFCSLNTHFKYLHNVINIES